MVLPSLLEVKDEEIFLLRGLVSLLLNGDGYTRVCVKAMCRCFNKAANSFLFLKENS